MYWDWVQIALQETFIQKSLVSSPGYKSWSFLIDLLLMTACLLLRDFDTAFPTVVPKSYDPGPGPADAVQRKT